MLKRQSSSVQVNEPCPSSVAATYRYDLSDWRFIPKSAHCGERVFGKMGRAETATGPAGLEMFETTIRFEHPSQWPSGMTQDHADRPDECGITHSPALTRRSDTLSHGAHDVDQSCPSISHQTIGNNPGNGIRGSTTLSSANRTCDGGRGARRFWAGSARCRCESCAADRGAQK